MMAFPKINIAIMFSPNTNTGDKKMVSITKKIVFSFVSCFIVQIKNPVSDWAFDWWRWRELNPRVERVVVSTVQT